MTADRHLRHQLQSFLHHRIRLVAVAAEGFTWPGSLALIVQSAAFAAFRWYAIETRDGSRIFGIRRLREEPPSSFMRFAVEGLHVYAMRHLEFLPDDLSHGRYLVAELFSADETLVYECADTALHDWRILEEYRFGRIEPPIATMTRNGERSDDATRVATRDFPKVRVRA